MKTAAAIALILASSSVGAANWVKVAAGGNSTFSVDASSIKRNGGTAVFWTRQEFSSITTTGSGVSYDKLVGLQVVDCELMRHRSLQYAAYLGSTHQHTAKHDKSEWEFLTPQTLIHSAAEIVCEASAKQNRSNLRSY